MTNWLSGYLNVHPGSYTAGQQTLGDIGLSEKVSDFFGQGRTDQGGSNLYGDQSKTTLVPTGDGGYTQSGTSGAYGISSTYQPGSVLPASTGPSPAPSAPTNNGIDWSQGLTGEQVRAMGLNPDTMISQNGLYYNSNGGDGGGSAELDAGYNDYFKMLDEQMGALGGQRANQEQIAQNTYNQGLNTATGQLGQAQNQLEGNRKKTLNDLTDNLMASFRQGNQLLGTRGASDSSAANQYSYAIAKQGNKSRGDVQSQYDQNLFQLKNTYDTETKNLELQKNSQLQQIAGWFAEAQNALRQQKGQAALQKSQQALSMAMQAAQEVNSRVAEKQSLLDQWAANHATSFQQLANQLGQRGSFSVQAPGNYGQITTSSPGSTGGAFTGYGSSTEKDLFGNPIYR